MTTLKLPTQIAKPHKHKKSKMGVSHNTSWMDLWSGQHIYLTTITGVTFRGKMITRTFDIKITNETTGIATVLHKTNIGFMSLIPPSLRSPAIAEQESADE